MITRTASRLRSLPISSSLRANCGIVSTLFVVISRAFRWSNAGFKPKKMRRILKADPKNQKSFRVPVYVQARARANFACTCARARVGLGARVGVRCVHALGRVGSCVRLECPA